MKALAIAATVLTLILGAWGGYSAVESFKAAQAAHAARVSA